MWCNFPSFKDDLSKQVLSEYSEGEGNKDLTEIDEQVMNQIYQEVNNHTFPILVCGTPKGKTLELFGRKQDDGKVLSVPHLLYGTKYI